MTTHHDRTGQTEMRECRRGPCWLGDGHDGPCRPGGRPHPDDETDDDDMWSHVGLQLRPILPVFTRLDRERGDARAMASLWKEVARRHITATRYWQDQHERMTERTLHMMARAEKAEREVTKLRAEQSPRPLTADDITDEAYHRAVRVLRDKFPATVATYSAQGHDKIVRAVVTAALTEPPARPEWEQVESLLREMPPGTVTQGSKWLVERGVRVVTEEER